uniref:Uncharacterized protein n=1 Tax=Panagrellus redivivus TaxID=6233 RepID=A0A7E4UP89_PANRE
MPRKRKNNNVISERGLQQRAACKERIAELANQCDAIVAGTNPDFLKEREAIDREFHKQRVSLYKDLQQRHKAITRRTVGNRECIQMATEHRVMEAKKVFATEYRRTKDGRIQKFKDAMKEFEFLDKEIQEKKERDEAARKAKKPVRR